MAIWQFSVEFIPRAWLDAGGQADALFGEEGHNAHLAWRDHSPLADLDVLFSGVLPEAESWHEQLTLWGDEKRTDAHVWRRGGRVESIGLRFDVRDSDARLLSEIAEIASGLDCVLLIPETKRVIEPTVFALNHAMRESRAARFVQDPVAFLHSLGDEPKRDK